MGKQWVKFLPFRYKSDLKIFEKEHYLVTNQMTRLFVEAKL